MRCVSAAAGGGATVGGLASAADLSATLESLQSLLSPADLAQVLAHNAQEFPDGLASLLAPYTMQSAPPAAVPQASVAWGHWQVGWTDLISVPLDGN